MQIEKNINFLFDEDKYFKYEIYPKPQKINYGINSYYISDGFKYVFSGVDINNQKTLERIISKDKVSENGIIIDVRCSDELKKDDEYFLSISNDGVKIKGKNQNAIHYALMTLEQILNQNKSFLREVDITDYPSQKIRGLIEGYYGIPYTTEIRMDLMKFCSKFKANSFVYAPKDDPYHREKWFELYPEEILDDFRVLGKLGDEIRTRFIWTISPFKKDCNPINEEYYDERIKYLLNKLDQIYDVGIRQFGVLGDDVGALPKSIVVKVMNRVTEWAKTKEDYIYDFLFVPEGYVLADWGFRPDELDLYSNEFPENVQIMFTGDTTCAPITKKSIQDFKFRETKIGERRNPLFWLNWPVNDIDRTTYRRLFMGKGEVLNNDVSDLVGTLTNPLEEGYATMVSLFAVADYSWNTAGFDKDKSWEASFKYIEKNSHKELFEICKHMSNTDTLETNFNDGSISNLEESEELSLYINDFEKNIFSEKEEEYLMPLIKLKLEYEKIVKNVEHYINNANNTKLLIQIKPYILNLRDKSLSAVKYLECIYCIKNNDLEKAGILFNKANKYILNSFKHEVYTRTSEFPAKTLISVAGKHRIDKNIEKIREYIQKNYKK